MSVNTGAPWGGHTQGSREELQGVASKAGGRGGSEIWGLTRSQDLGWPPRPPGRREVEKC